MKNIKRQRPEDREVSQVLFQFVLICGAILIAAPPDAGAQKTSTTRVECCGKLRFNNVAVAGAATGTTVMFDGVTWELVLPDDKCKKFAHDHHKQPVKVSGTLKKVSGKAPDDRWVVEVVELVESKANPGATIEVDGILEQKDSTFSLRTDDNINLPIDVSQNATLSAKAKTLTTKKVKLAGRVEKIEGPVLPAKIKIVANQLDAATIR